MDRSNTPPPPDRSNTAPEVPADLRLRISQLSIAELLRLLQFVVQELQFRERLSRLLDQQPAPRGTSDSETESDYGSQDWREEY